MPLYHPLPFLPLCVHPAPLLMLISPLPSPHLASGPLEAADDCAEGLQNVTGCLCRAGQLALDLTVCNPLGQHGFDWWQQHRSLHGDGQGHKGTRRGRAGVIPCAPFTRAVLPPPVPLLTSGAVCRSSACTGTCLKLVTSFLAPPGAAPPLPLLLAVVVDALLPLATLTVSLLC